jgi:hypothetical protein
VAATAAIAPDADEALDSINARTMQLVRDSAPPGLRASDGSTPHRRFIEGFAELL